MRTLFSNLVLTAVLISAGGFSQSAYAKENSTNGSFDAQQMNWEGNRPSGIMGEYRLQPEDILQITVYEEPTLTTEARVSAQGEINFPLLGNVPAAGLSAAELQTQLTTLLEADYLVNPQVQVFIKTYHSRNISVTGAVNKPGSYAMPPGKPTLVMEAIAMAGGFAKGAAIEKIRIIRNENGRPLTIDANAKNIIKGDKSKDVEIHPDDVIFVPESWL